MLEVIELLMIVAVVCTLWTITVPSGARGVVVTNDVVGQNPSG